MNERSATNQELAALRIVLWEITERARQAIMQLDACVTARRDVGVTACGDGSVMGQGDACGMDQGDIPVAARCHASVRACGDRCVTDPRDVRESGAADVSSHLGDALMEGAVRRRLAPLVSAHGSMVGAANIVAGHPGYSREVTRALRHIELHFAGPISLARLARVAGCSRSTLSRAFRREVGQTAHAYLVRLRLGRAASAMTSGDKIEAVMLDAGFRSKRNFYRLFKARFGRTPAQFGQARSDQQEQGGDVR